MNEETKNRRLLTVNDWVKAHGRPTHGALRHLIFNAETNGFAKVIRRVGIRVLIDETEFFKWLDSQQPKEKLEK